MSKRKQRLSVAYNTDEMTVTFTVLNASDQVLETASFDFDEVHESLQPKASLYGLNKLLTDRTSEKKDKVEKLAAMQEVMDQLSEGEWAKERVVGAPVTSPEVEALAELKGITVPQAQKALAGYTKDQRAKVLANPKVTDLAKTIKERREAQAVASLDDLL